MQTTMPSELDEMTASSSTGPSTIDCGDAGEEPLVCSGDTGSEEEDEWSVSG